MTGAFLAAATLFVLFNPYLKDREQEKHVVRGSPGSEITAMCYGEYFPSPGPLSNSEGPYSVDAHQRLNALVPEPIAFLAEFLGTLVLAMVVFAVTDEHNPGAPPVGMAPAFIGLTVSALISVIAPLIQACFNPARDFGPRLFAFLAGWGSIALPGTRGTDSSPSTSSPQFWVRSSAPVFTSTSSELRTLPVMTRTPRLMDDLGIVGEGSADAHGFSHS